MGNIRQTKGVIEQYEKSLGAVHLGKHNIVITTETALKLTNKYFK
ncbi:MAG: hypothetical protein NWR46_12085 [Saprospiraceae bacterium]|nr:hypothetical protein [Saprospiraceae bacterium]MDP4915127.1 hypothetical protein [Saprospiraceae bacterium]